jgi:hypothetical protein
MAEIGFLNSSDSKCKLTILNFERKIRAKWIKKPNKATYRITFSIRFLVFSDRKTGYILFSKTIFSSF